MLNVRHLAVFRAIMQMGTVSGAARMLNVSQPALTKSLQIIEGRLGVALFDRIKGRLHPTPDSEVLLPEVERLFSSMRSVELLANQIRQGQVGHLKIASIAALSSSILPIAAAEFLQERQKVGLEIRALSTRAVVQEVSNNVVDLGVVDVPLGGTHFETIDLCEARLGCVVRRDHPLAGRASLGPADLAEHSLVTFSEDTLIGWELRDAFRSAHVTLPDPIVTNQTIIACSLVRHSNSVAIVDPFPLLPSPPDDLAIIPFVPEIKFHPCIILPPERPRSVVAKRFVDKMKATVEALCANSPLIKPV